MLKHINLGKMRPEAGSFEALKAMLKRGGGYCWLRYCCLELLDREPFVQFRREDKLEKLELRNLSSMRVSNPIIPPSEISNASGTSEPHVETVRFEDMRSDLWSALGASKLWGFETRDLNPRVAPSKNICIYIYIYIHTYIHTYTYTYSTYCFNIRSESLAPTSSDSGVLCRSARPAQAESLAIPETSAPASWVPSLMGTLSCRET